MSDKESPFDMAKRINEKLGYVDVSETGYEPYMINRILSNTADTILFANEMNHYWRLPKQWQFDFYYAALSKKKRYGKWHKNQDDVQALELIQEFFGYSRAKAKDVLELLRPMLPEIAIELNKGGRNVKKG